MASGDQSHFLPAPSPWTSTQTVVIQGRCQKRSRKDRGGGEGQGTDIFSLWLVGSGAALHRGDSTAIGKVD